MKKKRGAPRAKDTTKKVKKKTSVLVQERVEYVDYKDVNLLSRFMSDRSKIRARRVSGNDSQQQRDVATAIKNAREMALLPYTKRVTTQRGGRGEGRREREEVVERVAATEEVAGDEVEVVEEVTVTEVEEG